MLFISDFLRLGLCSKGFLPVLITNEKGRCHSNIINLIKNKKRLGNRVKKN